jgi:hypothetical protein
MSAELRGAKAVHRSLHFRPHSSSSEDNIHHTVSKALRSQQPYKVVSALLIIADMFHRVYGHIAKKRWL